MTDASGLELRRASIPFGSGGGLRDITLRLDRSERLALLGPSGAGKTSILRAAAGLQPLGAGQILVGGRDVTSLPPERRGIVYLHQTPSLFPHLSVIDNVGFPLETRGMSRRAARARAVEFLDRVRLADLVTRDPATLSGGQRHRVALARALAAAPEVLLLDEPFAALDPALRSDVRDATFAALAGGDAPAVVIVTHDVDEALLVADRVAVLLGGALAQDATPASLLAQPASVEVAKFLGIPNIVIGERDGAGRFQSALGCLPGDGPAGPAVVVCGPDAIRARATSAAAATGQVTDVLHRVGGTVVRVAMGDQVMLATPDRTCEASRALAVGDRVSLDIVPPRLHILTLHAPVRGRIGDV